MPKFIGLSKDKYNFEVPNQKKYRNRTVQIDDPNLKLPFHENSNFSHVVDAMKKS